PLDVNQDGHISSIDALLIVNDLNNGGSRPLSVMSLASQNFVLPKNLLDVSLDDNVSSIDALLVINKLNSLVASQAKVGGAAGEGEGEGSMLAGEGEASGDSTDVALDTLLTTATDSAASTV